MDMKRILQAMDGAATKPVAGVSDMARFLQAVDSADKAQPLVEGKNPHKVTLPVQMAMQHYQQPKSVAKPRSTGLLEKYYHQVEQEFNEEQAQEYAVREQHIRMYSQQIAERVLMKEGWFDSSKPAPKVDWNKRAKELFGKGLNEQQVQAQLIKEGCPPSQAPVYVQAGQLEENEIAGHSMGFTGGAGPGMGNYVVDEAPIAMDPSEPNNPTIHSHQKANSAKLQERIARCRLQLQELAELSKTNDLAAWEHICKLAKGGMFMGLEQNLEQIRHGIHELAQARKTGRGVPGGAVRSQINKDIGEANQAIREAKKKKTLKNSNPCWDGYKAVGTKKKGGRTVPNCVPKE